MKSKIQLLFFCGLLLTSCSTVAHLQTDDATDKYSPTLADAIEVYSTDDIGKDYTVIGEVVANVDAGEDASITIRYLKKEAAALGADGIINLKLEFDYGYWSNAIKANGTAVKFKN